MALGSLLIWFILKDKLFLLYPGMFFLEALYLVYFSGEGLRLARVVATGGLCPHSPGTCL